MEKLFVKVVTIEHLVQPPLPSVIRRLLSNHVMHIPVHPELYPVQAIRDGASSRGGGGASVASC